MPYVVTTRRPSGHPESLEGYTLRVTRRAVATLEDRQRPDGTIEQGARSVTMDVITDARRRDRSLVSDYGEFYLEARVLPESGGTVGPLPDGTVIEVKMVEWPWLASQVGGGAYLPETEIIAAFNAREASGDA